jgi:hypothetical protein
MLVESPTAGLDGRGAGCGRVGRYGGAIDRLFLGLRGCRDWLPVGRDILIWLGELCRPT